MGTIADKLIHLGQTKAEIREAIISKGVTVPVQTTFREYAGKILEITSEGAEDPVDWKRPADWLPIEKMVSEGDQKFVGLHAIFEDSNFISLSATGDYTVDWGDGVVENFASGVQAFHLYSYDAFKGTESERGYRQAIVTVTPQAGQDLTALNLQKKYSQTGLNSYSPGWLDIRMSGPNMTSLTIGGIPLNHRYLEAFCFLGKNQITNFNRCFYGCYALQLIELLDTSNATSFDEAFGFCIALQKMPLLDTSKVTNFSNMFMQCSSLQAIPLFNTSNGTRFSNMFMQCYALRSVPLLDTSNGTNFGGMFLQCGRLTSVPVLDTSKGVDFNSMFSQCSALQSVPFFDTSNGVDFSNMFRLCAALQKVPLFTTSKGTNFNNMFSYGTVLQTFPLFDTTNGTDFNSMFSNCYALQKVPLFNTSKGINFSGMFATCISLQKVPLFDTSQGSGLNNMFYNCSALFQASCSGTKNSISYSSCKLSRNALVDIFNNLASGVVAKTITITNNWGALLLTEEERAIATGKGWMIVG